MEKALWRDDFTCRCCGFKSKKFQRVIPSEVGDDFVTVCSFCELSFSLDQTGMTGAGVLIWLPEISQADLNHIMRAIYIARASTASPQLSEAATRAYDALLARRVDAKKRLGGDDPLLLATVFHESLNDKEYANCKSKLEGIKLLPIDRWLVRGRDGDSNQFPKILEYWTSPEGPFGNIKPESWSELFSSTIGKVEAAN